MDSATSAGGGRAHIKLVFRMFSARLCAEELDLNMEITFQSGLDGATSVDSPALLPQPAGMLN